MPRPIFYVLRAAGCQWRMVPHDLAPWWVAYRWYRSWAADGVWDTVHDGLRARVRTAAGRDPDPSSAVLYPQSIKAVRLARRAGSTWAKRPPGKRHLIVDTLGLLLVVMVTSATVQDCPGRRTVLQRLAARFPSVALVWADGGYANKIDSSLLGWAKEKLGLLVEIV